MRRLGSMSTAVLVSSLFWMASHTSAQEPDAIGSAYIGDTVAGDTMPGGTIGEGSTASVPYNGGVIAPRTDLYSTYSEAFTNPDAIACQTGAEMGRQLRAPRHYRWIFDYEQIRWGRTNGGNQVLTRTTPNIFDLEPGAVGPLINAGADPLYGIPGDAFSTDGSGLITTFTPNSPGVGQYFSAGANPNGSAASILFTVENPQQPLDETLTSGEVRTQTDDFDHGREYGFRPTLGIEFQDESRLTFTYWWVSDFEARLMEDVSGLAFLTRVVTDNSDPFLPQFQRFGILTSEFSTTALPAFYGERVRTAHDPANESPPVLLTTGGVPTTVDVPREATTNEGAIPEEVITGPSLLWQDGEVMIADYNYDVQGADIKFEKSLFRWFNTNWKLWGIMGVKYLALDEGFTFTFADLAPFGPIGNTGYYANNPFDRAIANAPDPDTLIGNQTAQPSPETVAIHNISMDNDYIAPEFGIRAVRPVLGVFEVDLTGIGSFGANFLQKDSTLVRGDGLVGFIREREEVATSAMFEWRLGMNFVPHPNVRLKAGFEALWFINAGTAISNIEFDLDQDTRPSNEDEILFYGWYFGGEILF